MAASTKCQNLSDLRSFLRRFSINQSNIETDEIHVIDIQRYLGDPRHQAQTRGVAGQALDVVQVTVADGSHKMKMLLQSDLNTRVQRHELVVGSTVKVTKCSLHFDETDLSGSGVVVVQEVEITGLAHITQQQLQGLQWSPDCSRHEREDVPLTSGRGYFVNLWSSMEMTGLVWNLEENTLQGLGDTREVDLYRIKDLATKWNSIRAAKPAILVRAVMKSRLIHYAKPNKDDKWPFQAHILVADTSGACTAVLWNEMCPKFYHRIREGSLLLLKGFTVKKGFQFVPRFRPVLKDTEYYDIDINLNRHHPASEVRLIDPAILSDNVQLVPLRYKLLNRQQVGALPSNSVCDIVGVVTYIGRFEREPIVNKYGFDSGGFWVRRWLHLRDRSCRKPFIVQVYRLAEVVLQFLALTHWDPCLRYMSLVTRKPVFGVFDQGRRDIVIQPGSVVMITNVRVIQKFNQEAPSQDERYMFLSTTAESHVTMVTETSSIRDHVTARDVLVWSESTEARRLVGRCLVGGYYSYPPLPSTVPGIKSCFKDQLIVSSEDWQKMLTSLCYREGRQMMVQAVMVCVKLKNLESVNRTGSTSPRKGRHSRQRKPSAQEMILDSSVYQSDEGLPTLGTTTTDGGTLPMIYSTDKWDHIKQRLDFTCVDHSRTTDSLDTRQVPYFSVVWVGLNTKILLQTILLCPHKLATDMQFLDILSGHGLAPSSLVSETQYTASETRLSSVMDSVRQCASKRFLLVLDCYQENGEQTEIVLHRAVPVGDI